MCASTKSRKMIPVTAMTIFRATVVRSPLTCRAAEVVVDTTSIVSTSPGVLLTAAPDGGAEPGRTGRAAPRLRFPHDHRPRPRLPRRRPRRGSRHPPVAAVAPVAAEVPARPHRDGPHAAPGHLGPARAAHR